MASADAKPFPIKNAAYRVTFPILDADGDLVSGAADLDSQVSKDGGTFAACTSEATEIATASGMYYLDLTSDEMNADTVAIIVKTTTAGAKTTPIVLYPVENTDIPVNVKAISDDTTAPDNLELMYDGTGYAGGTTKLGVQVKGMDASVLTAAAIATDAITNAKIAVDAIGASEFAQAAADKIRASICVTGDPANSIGKILYEIYINRLTSTRASYLDNLSAGAVALAAGVDLTKIHGVALTETVDGYLAAGFVKLFDVVTPLLVASDAMRGTNSAALATVCTDTRLGELDSANLPSDIGDILADTGTSGVVVATASKTGYALSAAGVDAILDEVVEGALTLRQIQRIVLSALAGKSTGGGTTSLKFRDYADGKDRVSATVDNNNNRTAITLDGS